jgi:hypothetical protein
MWGDYSPECQVRKARQINSHEAITKLRKWREDFARLMREQGIAANATPRALSGKNKGKTKDAIYLTQWRGASDAVRAFRGSTAPNTRSGYEKRQTAATASAGTPPDILGMRSGHKARMTADANCRRPLYSFCT